MGEEKNFRLGWVFVSYFMIAGGLMVAASALGVMRVTNQFVGYGVYFFGAAFGGFFAGRASPGKTVLEPAIAGALLFATFVAFIAAVPGARAVWRLAGDGIIAKAAGVGALMAAGGLVGAMLGERSSDGTQSDSRIRWIGISSLITLGMLFFLFMLLAILMLRHVVAGGKLTDDQGTTVVFLALGGSALFGGAVTQAIAPLRMLIPAGAGFMCVVFALIGIATAATNAPVNDQAILGFVIIGIGGWIVGIIGAAIAWQFVKNKARGTGGPDVAQAFE